MRESCGTFEVCETTFVGCCGAYCRACRSYVLGHCVGCRLGYEDGSRDIARTRCKIKSCCFGSKELETCAECPDYRSCRILESFHGKGGREYEGYRASLEFIARNGCEEFVKRAKGWKRAYGEL